MSCARALFRGSGAPLVGAALYGKPARAKGMTRAIPLPALQSRREVFRSFIAGLHNSPAQVSTPAADRRRP